MAGEQVFNISGTASALMNIVIMIIMIITPIIITIGMFWLIKWFRKYRQYKLIIFKHDGFGHLTVTYDNGGVFINKKTKAKRLWMKKANTGLPPDNIPFIQTPSGKVVYLFQTASKTFRYIKFSIPQGKFKFTVGEEDVNWAIHDYEMDKKQFMSDRFLQYLPYITLGFVSLTILMLFIYFFKNFGVLRDVALAFKEAAKSLALTQSGTTIMT